MNDQATKPAYVTRPQGVIVYFLFLADKVHEDRIIIIWLQSSEGNLTEEPKPSQHMWH